MFRKNLKNIRAFQILLRNINHECHTSRPNKISITSGSRFSHRCFATAALPNYNHKEITEVENLNTTSLKDIDHAFIEIDSVVKRTGGCNKRTVENILTEIVKLRSDSSIHGLYLLRCCGLMHKETLNERVQLVNDVWKTLHKLNVHLDVRHYNSLLKVFVDCDHKFLPTEFLASMENLNIQANKITYLLLLEKYCNDGNLSGAGEILQVLKDQGLPINETVFAILIKGHMRANDVLGAKDILQVMRSASLSPTAESYTALACGFAEKANIDGLNSILTEARDNEVIFSNKHYLSIICSWSDAENVKLIDDMFEKIADHYEWRHDIANAMMGLMHKGMERDNIAFQLLLRIAKPENNFADIFVKILLKCDRPKEYVVDYCEEISARNLHSYIFMNAAKTAMDLGKFELSLTIFELLQKKGIPVRRNNFNLLLSSFKGQEEGTWMTLRKMFELGLSADFFTYFEYVFPAVSVSDPEAIISKIQETGHSFTSAIDPLFQFYCYNGSFENALYLVEKYPVSVHLSFCLKKYINVCTNNRSYSKACLKVLNHLLQNVGVHTQDPEVAEGMNVATLIEQDHSLFEALLGARHEKIQLSSKSFDVCSTVLRRNNPESLRHLRRLDNFRNRSEGRKTSRSITYEEEELRVLKEKGLPVQHFLLECLSTHLQQRNITRINQLTDDLDNQGVQYPPRILSQLLSFYSQNNDIEKAEKYFKVLKSDCPTFCLDSLKVLDYASLLIKFSKFDDALNLIKTECQDIHLYGHSKAAFNRILKKLLSISVETGNSDLVKNLQDALSPHAEILETDVLYEPLVKIHLYKDDLDNAINEFEKCVRNHRVAPCLKMLIKKCIVTENSTKLEIVMNTASTLFGKQVMIYDLVVAFLETGRKSEAKKIMENLKNKQYSRYLEDIFTQMYNQNKVFDMLEFVNILWSVNHVDREKIVHHILKLCSKQKDLKTARDLQKYVLKSFQLNEENKQLFSNFISEIEEQVSTTSKSNISAFLQCVEKKDTSEGLKILQSMKKNVVRTIEFNYMTNFLDLLIKDKILNEFSQNANAFSYVSEKSDEILKPLLENFSNSGDLESLNEVGKNFPDFALKKCSFNRYFSKAYISQGKHEDLLLELEKHCNKKNNYFSVFAFEELLKRADLEDKVINLAKKYLESNCDTPIAVVWAHYLIQGRYEEAEAFYKSHSVSAGNVDIMILRSIRQQENITLGKTYISILNNTDVQKRCKQRAYETVLNMLVLKEMHDDAAALVVEAQAKDIDLEKHCQSTLLTLKKALERKKKNVQFLTPSEGHVISE